MATSPPEEIKVGQVAIRFLVEGERSGGSVAVSAGVAPLRLIQSKADV